MSSRLDDTFAALRALGYTGSIQDMQLAAMRVKNANATKGTCADNQKANGLIVRDLLAVGDM